MRRTSACVRLENDAHISIAAETRKRLPAEAGGILLGYYENKNIVVTNALVVEGDSPSFTQYVRDDVKANALLRAFLDGRASDDPIGYVGEWHSHPAPRGPSRTDISAMHAIARASDRPIALLVHIPSHSFQFSGLIVERARFGRVSTKEATISLPRNRFQPLRTLPEGAVRTGGPVFISYRHSDGIAQAESLANLLRAAGLVVWRDQTDLLAGTTVDRLEQALTEGLSAAVLVVTPEIASSEIVRERELPRLLELDDDPAFSLCIANKVARAENSSKCDFEAPDRLLGLAPARVLADKKQSDMFDPSGEMEIVRDLLMHRVQLRKPEIRSAGKPFTIRVQSRPAPFAIDAGENDLHIRIEAASSGRLPSPDGLRLIKSTLPLISDAVYASEAKVVQIAGGAHLSVALALGAALPETKIGVLEIIDVEGFKWTSVIAEGGSATDIRTKIIQGDESRKPRVRDRVAIFVSLSLAPDLTAFERLIQDSTGGFNTAAIISVTGNDKIDSGDSGRLSAAIARTIKQIAAGSGRAEVHLAFHGPYAMAVLIGRHFNTLRVVAYEWDTETTGETGYTPVLVLEPGTATGPVAEVLI